MTPAQSFPPCSRLLALGIAGTCWGLRTFQSVGLPMPPISAGGGGGEAGSLEDAPGVLCGACPRRSSRTPHPPRSSASCTASSGTQLHLLPSSGCLHQPASVSGNLGSRDCLARKGVTNKFPHAALLFNALDRKQE